MMCADCKEEVIALRAKGGGIEIEKQIAEFNRFGITTNVAQEVIASHTIEQVEVILDFLCNYGDMIVTEQSTVRPN